MDDKEKKTRIQQIIAELRRELRGYNGEDPGRFGDSIAVLGANLRDAADGRAVRARDAAVSIRASIDEAIAAHKRRDVIRVAAALTDAYRVEKEWGDEPSTRAAIKALLGGGWTAVYTHGELRLERPS